MNTLFALVLIVVLEGGWSEEVIQENLTEKQCQTLNIKMYNGYAQCVPMEK